MLGHFSTLCIKGLNETKIWKQFSFMKTCNTMKEKNFKLTLFDLIFLLHQGLKVFTRAFFYKQHLYKQR